MTLTTIQRKLLILLVASLIIAAVLALAIVLFGNLGNTGGRVLGTTVALAAFSITGMASSVPAKDGRTGALAKIGLVASAVAFGLCVYFIWVNDSFDTATVSLAKVLAVAIIIAVACAHAALLLRGRGNGDATDMVVAGTLICTVSLAAMLSAMIIGEWFGDGSGRLLGALAILAVLGTLLTPLLPRILGATQRPGTE